jgi:hypothetical protein
VRYKGEDVATLDRIKQYLEENFTFWDEVIDGPVMDRLVTDNQETIEFGIHVSARACDISDEVARRVAGLKWIPEETRRA